MWKMVFCLCAAMYGLALLVGPAEKAKNVEQAEIVAETPEVVLASIVKPAPRPEVIQAAFDPNDAATPAQDVSPQPIAITETALDAPAKPKRPEVVMRDISFIAPMRTPARTPEVDIVLPEASVETAPEKPTVTVTARSVNLRAGPSTGHSILGSLKRGTEAVLVDDLGNGWSKISVEDSNLRGFIASRFLAES